MQLQEDKQLLSAPFNMLKEMTSHINVSLVFGLINVNR